jgi:hypothetical protein
VDVSYGERMELPPEDDIRWIVSRYAHLRAEHGEAVGVPDLIEPTGDFFPDAFAPSAEGVSVLLKRLLSYAPLGGEIPIELAFAEGEGGGGSCGTGGCGTGGGESEKAGTVAEALPHSQGEGYRLVLPVRDVGDPVLLATSLARCVGGMVLGEAGEDVSERERLTTAEIAATALCGFGLLQLCGACVYTKSCGGLRAHQGTRLDVASSALALALFVRVHDVKPGNARKHLETTQREALDEALRWVDSNAKIVGALRAHPESLADGVFAIEETKGIFGRLFGAKPAASAEEIVAPVVVKKRVRTEAEERALAENKRLVEEALRGG